MKSFVKLYKFNNRYTNNLSNDLTKIHTKVMTLKYYLFIIVQPLFVHLLYFKVGFSDVILSINKFIDFLVNLIN